MPDVTQAHPTAPTTHIMATRTGEQLELENVYPIKTQWKIVVNIFDGSWGIASDYN